MSNSLIRPDCQLKYYGTLACFTCITGALLLKNQKSKIVALEILSLHAMFALSRLSDHYSYHWGKEIPYDENSSIRSNNYSLQHADKFISWQSFVAGIICGCVLAVSAQSNLPDVNTNKIVNFKQLAPFKIIQLALAVFYGGYKDTKKRGSFPVKTAAEIGTSDWHTYKEQCINVETKNERAFSKRLTTTASIFMMTQIFLIASIIMYRKQFPLNKL